jgi:hypothetical protein
MLDTDSNKGWRKTLPSMKELLEGAKLMPAITLSLEYVDVAAAMREGKLQLRNDTPLCNGDADQANHQGETSPQGAAAPNDDVNSTLIHTAGQDQGVDGSAAADRPSEGAEDSEELEQQVQVQQTESALVEVGGASWEDAFKGPNAKAWNVLFGQDAPQIDLVVVSYSIFESHEATRGLGWKFYEDMILQASPGSVFVIIDVLSRSRVYLDEVSSACTVSHCTCQVYSHTYLCHSTPPSFIHIYTHRVHSPIDSTCASVDRGSMRMP